jgi:hypothetical protein
LSQGNIKKQMAAGIENAQCVVVFITKRYVDKVGGTNPEDNCQLEFNYAARRKGANKMIAVVMEERMRNASTWVGEVGLVLGGRLYADMTGNFSDSEYLNCCADDLFARIIKVIGKPVPSFDLLLDPHSLSYHLPPPNPSDDPHGLSPSATSSSQRVGNVKPLDQLTIEEVSSLLNNLKLGKFVPLLQENEVDGATLALCKTEEEIVEIGVTIQLKARVLFAKIQIYRRDGVPLTDLTRHEESAAKTSQRVEPIAQQQPSQQQKSQSSSSTSASTPSSSPQHYSSQAIGIHGATGPCALLNGIYEVTEETFGGMKRYKKVTGDHWMEFNSAQGRWHCKPGSKKGTLEAWAFLTTPSVGVLPYDATDHWHVYDGSEFHSQPQIVTYSAASFAIYGSLIPYLNGVYDPTEEMFSGTCRYRRRDLADVWIEYSSSQSQWHITRNQDKGTHQAFAYAATSSKSSPCLQQEPRLSWFTYNATTKAFDENKDFIVIPEPKPLTVSGGQGPTAIYVRGIYDPTEEVYNRWVRYQKRDDPDSWIEYLASQKQWHIKPTSSKTQTNAWVMVGSPLQNPSEVTSAWSVYDGSSFHADPTLTVK